MIYLSLDTIVAKEPQNLVVVNFIIYPSIYHLIYLSTWFFLRFFLKRFFSLLFIKEADVAAAPLTVTLIREMAVDFLFPFQTSEASILMRRRHPDQEPKIQSLEDLVQQTEVDYGVLRDGSIAKVMGEIDR